MSQNFDNETEKTEMEETSLKSYKDSISFKSYMERTSLKSYKDSISFKSYMKVPSFKSNREHVSKSGMDKPVLTSLSLEKEKKLIKSENRRSKETMFQNTDNETERTQTEPIRLQSYKEQPSSKSNIEQISKSRMDKPVLTSSQEEKKSLEPENSTLKEKNEVKDMKTNYRNIENSPFSSSLIKTRRINLPETEDEVVSKYTRESDKRNKTLNIFKAISVVSIANATVLIPAIVILQGFMMYATSRAIYEDATSIYKKFILFGFYLASITCLCFGFSNFYGKYCSTKQNIIQWTKCLIGFLFLSLSAAQYIILGHMLHMYIKIELNEGNLPDVDMNNIGEIGLYLILIALYFIWRQNK